MIPERLRPMPNPPRLYWGIVFASQVLTLGLFQFVWLVVQANWVRRVNGKSDAFVWSVINLCMPVAVFLLTAIESIVGVPADHPVFVVIGFVSRIGLFLTSIGTLFSLQNELENLPIDLSLNRFLTFFVGTIYFQYHLCDYSVRGKVVPMRPPELAR